MAHEICFFLIVVPRLSCPEAHGISVAQPGIEPVSPALECGFLTTEPPGESPSSSCWWLQMFPVALLQGPPQPSHGLLPFLFVFSASFMRALVIGFGAQPDYLWQYHLRFWISLCLQRNIIQKNPNKIIFTGPGYEAVEVFFGGDTTQPTTMFWVLGWICVLPHMAKEILQV